MPGASTNSRASNHTIAAPSSLSTSFSPSQPILLPINTSATRLASSAIPLTSSRSATRSPFPHGDPHRDATETAAATSRSSPAPTPSASSALSLDTSPSVGTQDFEMEPIAGHRRRKSSLLNPIGGTLGPPGRPLMEEPKISEEGRRPDNNFQLTNETSIDGLSDEDLHDDEETGLARKDKKRLQKKKRRNTKLDQRIAREKNLSGTERKEADKSVARRISINIFLIFLWYLFSLSISLVSCPVWVPFHPLSAMWLRLSHSTTSGCSTRRASTLRSRFSPPHSTC